MQITETNGQEIIDEHCTKKCLLNNIKKSKLKTLYACIMFSIVEQIVEVQMHVNFYQVFIYIHNNHVKKMLHLFLKANFSLFIFII